MKDSYRYKAPKALPEWLKIAKPDSLVSARDMCKLFEIKDSTLTHWEQRGWLPAAQRYRKSSFSGQGYERKRFWTAGAVRSLIQRLRIEEAEEQRARARAVRERVKRTPPADVLRAALGGLQQLDSYALLDIEQMTTVFGIGYSTIYDWMRRELLPRPLALDTMPRRVGGQRKYWRARDIIDAISRLPETQQST